MLPHLLGLRGPGRYLPPTGGGGGGGEGDPGSEEPPVVTTVDGDVTINGKIKPGSFGKIIVPLAAIGADRRYTFRVVANFSQLAKQGKLAMVGAGFKAGNDFHISGIRGDGASGSDEYIVHGTAPNGWNKLVGHTEVNGGDAASGTQHSAYYRLTISADGTTYDLDTGTDGAAWTSIFTDRAISPFSNVSAVTQFGVALWFNNADAGPYSVVVSEFLDAAAPLTDPHWANVTLLMGFEGTDGQTTSVDESSLAQTMQLLNGASIDTAQFKFGSSSVLLVDASSQYVRTASNANATADFGANDWTVEGWFKFATVSATQQILCGCWTTINRKIFQLYYASSQLVFQWSVDGSNVAGTVQGAWVPTVGPWFHVVAERSGGTIRLYVDGVMMASGAIGTAMIGSIDPFQIGRSTSNSNLMNGWVDDFRVTKMVARYASDSGYTVPTAAWPRQ